MISPNSVNDRYNAAAKASGFSTLLKDVRNMLQCMHDHAEAAKVAAPAMSDRRAAARQAAQERREQEGRTRRAAFEPKLALLLEKLQRHAAQTGISSQTSLTAGQFSLTVEHTIDLVRTIALLAGTGFLTCIVKPGEAWSLLLARTAVPAVVAHSQASICNLWLSNAFLHESSHGAKLLCRQQNSQTVLQSHVDNCCTLVPRCWKPWLCSSLDVIQSHWNHTVCAI